MLRAFESDPQMRRQGEVQNLVQATDYVRNLLQNPDQVPYAITCNDALVGLVCASTDRKHATGWFWYWMDAAYRGRQLCTRAAATLANHLLGEGGLHRLELGARANNPASLAVARAAGFVPEGIEREKFEMDGARVDVHTFGRLSRDPWPTTPTLPLDLS